MNNLILFMTLTGSIPLLFYYLIRRLFREHPASSGQTALLYLSMLFFMLPFPLLSLAFRSLPVMWDHSALFAVTAQSGSRVNVLADLPSSSASLPGWHLAPEKTFLISDGALNLPRQSPALILTLIWAAGFLISLVSICLSYRRVRKVLEKTTVYQCTLSAQILFFKRRVEIRTATDGRTMAAAPFSTGLFHPLIVLPQTNDPDARHCILLHELAHIQRFDFLLKLLGLLIRSLHWFNPLARSLVRELGIQQEFCADQSVLNQLDSRLQKKYGGLVLTALIQSAPPRKNFKFSVRLWSL